MFYYLPIQFLAALNAQVDVRREEEFGTKLRSRARLACASSYQNKYLSCGKQNRCRPIRFFNTSDQPNVRLKKCCA